MGLSDSFWASALLRDALRIWIRHGLRSLPLAKVALSADHHPCGAVSAASQKMPEETLKHCLPFSPEDLSRYLQIPDEELNAVEEETGGGADLDADRCTADLGILSKHRPSLLRLSHISSFSDF